MNDERDAFRAWLDRSSPTPDAQALDAERVWSSRRRLPRGSWLVTAAAAAALTAWWLRQPAPEPPAPEYQTRLLVSVADDEVRIDVGVRRKQDR